MSDDKVHGDQVVRSSETKPRRPRRNRKTDWLGDRLRQLYDSYGQAPIPAKMQEILEKLGDDPGGKSK